MQNLGETLVKIDAVHRNAIKTNKNTSNDIMYIKPGLTSLKGSVFVYQYKFWAKISKDIANNPHAPISQIYQQAIELIYHTNTPSFTATSKMLTNLCDYDHLNTETIAQKEQKTESLIFHLKTFLNGSVHS